MRTTEEVEARIRYLLVEELDRRLTQVGERLPQRCTHNIRHHLDSRRLVDGEPNPNYNRVADRRGLPVLQSIGLCGLGSENQETWPMDICDEPIAHDSVDFRRERTRVEELTEHDESERPKSISRIECQIGAHIAILRLLVFTGPVCPTAGFSGSAP